MAKGGFIKFAIKSTMRLVSKPKRIKEQIESMFLDTINSVTEKSIGRPDIFRMRSGGKPPSGASKLQDVKLDTSPSDSTKAETQRLLILYAEAWKNKYAIIRKRHRAMVPDGKYKKTAWHLRKRAMKNSRSVASHNDKVVKHSMQSLMTGFLRQSIGQSFKKGGDKYLRMGNPMLEGAVLPNWDAYSTPYPEDYENWLQKKGILDADDPLINFAQRDWDRIAAHVQMMWQSGWGEEMVEALNQMTIRTV